MIRLILLITFFLFSLNVNLFEIDFSKYNLFENEDSSFNINKTIEGETPIKEPSQINDQESQHSSLFTLQNFLIAAGGLLLGITLYYFYFYSGSTGGNLGENTDPTGFAVNSTKVSVYDEAHPPKTGIVLEGIPLSAKIKTAADILAMGKPPRIAIDDYETFQYLADIMYREIFRCNDSSYWTLQMAKAKVDPCTIVNMTGGYNAFLRSQYQELSRLKGREYSIYEWDDFRTLF